MVWSIARSFRLDDAAAKDVSQTVWLRLIENLGSIKDPERLPGWLATTTRREAMRVLGASRRAVPTEFAHDLADPSAPLEEMMIDDEESREVMAAFSTLDEACRQLLRLLITEPALGYEEIAGLVGRPIGSLGPTRSRCLDRLKTALARIRRGDGGS